MLDDYEAKWDANEKEGIILVVSDPDKQLEAIYGSAPPEILKLAVEIKYNIRVPDITLH